MIHTFFKAYEINILKSGNIHMTRTASGWSQFCLSAMSAHPQNVGVGK